MNPNSKNKLNVSKIEYDPYELYKKLVEILVKYAYQEMEGKINKYFGEQFKKMKEQFKKISEPILTSEEKNKMSNNFENNFFEAFSIQNLHKMNGICIGDNSLLSDDLNWLLGDVAQCLSIPKHFTLLSLLSHVSLCLEKPKKIIVRTLEDIINNLGGSNWV